MNRDAACLTRGYSRANIDPRRLYWQQQQTVVGGGRRRRVGGCERRRGAPRCRVFPESADGADLCCSRWGLGPSVTRVGEKHMQQLKRCFFLDGACSEHLLDPDLQSVHLGESSHASVAVHRSRSSPFLRGSKVRSGRGTVKIGPNSTQTFSHGCQKVPISRPGVFDVVLLGPSKSHACLRR